MNIIRLVATYGYAIVAIFVVIEGLGIPVPGEIVLITAAAFAAQGRLPEHMHGHWHAHAHRHFQVYLQEHLSLIGVILSAWIGVILGGSGGYWIGRTGGIVLIERYGHWVGLNHDKLIRAQQYFDSHGAKTIIVSRFVAILRMIAGILAGVARMSFGLFTVCNAIGGLLWSVTFGVLGYLFGQNLPLLEHYVRRASLTVLLLATVTGGVILWRRQRGPAMKE